MHLYSCKWFTVERSCGGASSPKFVDIDSDDKDPLLCSLYAPDIYYNLRVAELKRRPFPDFMEKTQRDVTETMRGILVDWLVEVSSLLPVCLLLTYEVFLCSFSQLKISGLRGIHTCT
jgi:cyclin A